MTYPKELTNTYDILEQIGEGGGGTVYRAVHKRLQKTVVLKKIKGAAASILDCRTEVDILKNLRHSYLPQVLDFIESPEGIFTVMDFIPGKSLQKLLDEGHEFKEKEVLKYGRQLCEALEYLHAQKPPIVHGDIKPDNIMVTPEGNICLIDFNISGVLEGGGMQTFGYTPGYSSPEQKKAFEEMCRVMQRKKQNTVQGAGGKNFGANGNTDNAVEFDEQATVMLDGETVMHGVDDATMMMDSDATVMPDNDATMMPDSEATVMVDGDATILPDSGERAKPQNQKTVSVVRQEKAVREAAVALEPVASVTIDKRSDIYSVGATLYALLTGKLPIAGKQTGLSGISSGLCIVLNKSLEWQPEKRYADAGKLLQALVSVHKKDKKYRSLLHRQEAVFVLLFLLLAASVLSVAEGVHQLEIEKKQTYTELVEELHRNVDDGVEYGFFEDGYSRAVALYPDRMAAYYEKARYLVLYDGADAAEEYIGGLFSLSLQGDEEMQSNLYYLYADCYFRMEEYSDAGFYYEKALSYWDENPSVYRDFAISLVYQGKIEKAEQILKKAEASGMQQADVFMVQGEIERMAGNAEKAIGCFGKVLENTEDEYLRQRAYIMASRTREASGTAEALREDVSWLSDAAQSLSMNNRLLIYERLTQDYISLGELTNDTGQFKNAVGTLEKIIEMKWDSYLTYGNVIVLCQRFGDLSLAKEWAGKMLEKYPQHYVTYMRLCYLEVELQNAKENKQRDYTIFAEYYNKARDAYKNQVSGNKTDAEMQRLESVYRQIEEGGWLK